MQNKFYFNNIYKLEPELIDNGVLIKILLNHFYLWIHMVAQAHQLLDEMIRFCLIESQKIWLLI